MPKLSINDLHIARSVDNTARNEPEDKDKLLRLKLDRVKAQNQTNDLLHSLPGKKICKGCLTGAALDALLTLTIPDDASQRESQRQERLIMAYVIQTALENHDEGKEGDFAVFPGSQHTTH
ncbi:hypothetical protein [Endozoicomonas atrinae]|uniref:hypothetical protein n=1 Tax=Endozoicomonas atrinae TaxID=1333660 RepID=UPI000825700A|nr:hypothetical protein [Endozoicomonas atrinae]